MTKNSFFLTALILGLFIFSSCSKDDDDTPTIQTKDISFNLTGLEDLGSDYAYEGWLIVDGAPVSAGIFTVDAEGNPSQTTFSLNEADVAAATTYVLTIEPSPDNDPSPSAVHILAGDFDGNNASLTVGHSAALATDFTDATGGYILATPTDGGMDTDENSGVWFLDPAAGPGAALNLPTLPDGWKYEGWAVIDGTPVSTGTFTEVTGADADGRFSGSAGGPPFPGEDFLINAPAGLTFPTNLAGATMVISVEPSPDNSANPFLLKPLVGQAPADAIDHTFYGMDSNAVNTNPSGSVTKK